jgi:hypothetical protein
MRNKRAVDVLRELVNKWFMYPMISSLRDRTDTGGLRPHGQPGDWLNSMSPEERTKLGELKSEDTANDRWPLYDGWFDKTEGDKERRLRLEARNKLPKE